MAASDFLAELADGFCVDLLASVFALDYLSVTVILRVSPPAASM